MLREWIETNREEYSDSIFFLVGNKSDLEENRAISVPQAEDFAKQIGADFLETSAKTGANIDALFISVADKSRESGTCETLDTSSIDVNDTTKGDGTGCC